MNIDQLLLGDARAANFNTSCSRTLCDRYQISKMGKVMLNVRGIATIPCNKVQHGSRFRIVREHN